MTYEPTSLFLESFGVNEDRHTVYIVCRAKYGFGGTNRDFLVFLDGASKQTVSAWRRHCRGKGQFDEMQTALLATRLTD